MSYQYPLSDFLADVMTVEDLKREWSLEVPFQQYIAEYFRGVHGNGDYVAWRYEKFMVVNIYVSQNILAFNTGDLAVAGKDKALVRGKLFKPVLEYAVKHNVSNVANFPEPRYFV